MYLAEEVCAFCKWLSMLVLFCNEQLGSAKVVEPLYSINSVV